MKRNLRILGKLWKVQTFNYFTDPVNMVLGMVLTIVTMVCWIAFKPTTGGISSDPFVLASAIGISIIRNSQYNLNLTIGDWRQKKLFVRMSYTPISKRLLIVSIISFNWFINILVALMLFGIAMIFSSQRAILHNVQWGPFLVGFILNVFLSNVMAFFISATIKNKDVGLVVSLISYFGPMYLLGLGIPWNVVGNYEGLNIFLYLAPHRYTLSIMQASWVGLAGNMSFPSPSSGFWDGVGQNINNLPVGGAKLNSWLDIHGFGFGGAGWWAPMLISFGWIALFGTATVMILKKRYIVGERKFKTYQGITKHLHYINEIKRTKSINELDALIDFINNSSTHKLRKKVIKMKVKTPSSKTKQKNNISKEND